MFLVTDSLSEWLIWLFVFLTLSSLCVSNEFRSMSERERVELRDEARDMFYHAYYAYMENAYPADELMPLSCAGRYRGLTPSRGDIDDSLGNFSLTLIDTLDTLVILGDLEEFEHAIKLVIKDVSFDNDVIVSVFETNIRVLGCDGLRWRCAGTVINRFKKRERCGGVFEFRTGTFFFRLKLSIFQILGFVHLWVANSPLTFICDELRIASNTAVDWASFCREVVLDAYILHKEKLGGPGKIVEIDESKFGKRKYHRGHFVEGQWVFGGYERGTGRVFMVAVPDRGLLSAHILTEYLQQNAEILSWYKGELLNMAKDVGYRLLPAFNTTTGIPYSRINLKYGVKSDRLESSKETCTACAGSIILEMAALSRLTGEPIFEEKAHRAMDELWKMRHRSSDLMGTVLNVHSGDWIRRDSGVGAGIDSYYEYCLKAYILLGDDRYLNRFNRHYNAVMKYISQGPMLLDVHMHRPHTNSRNYMDALLAFWPGLQVLNGDIKPAIETHEMLYQVMQRHKFIPEAFTTDFQVHWGNHPLRPEFLESTYFLYSATNDPYYLEVGKNVLKSLQRYARVSCGYAAVNDVRTGRQEDRMDSFVLAETFKYLFLLFADSDDLILNLDEFIFTTEGHLLPLTLGNYKTQSIMNYDFDDNEMTRVCPNSLSLFPESFRKPLKNMVDGMCPRRIGKRKLTAQEFSASNVNHLKLIKDMGISIIALNVGRVQLLHTFSTARTSADAEEGLLFMQEMIELSKMQQQTDAAPQAVSFPMKYNNGEVQIITLPAGPSHFGKNLRDDDRITAKTIIIHPLRACVDLPTTNKVKGKIAIMERGDCMFVEKARIVQKAGAVGAIIIDSTRGSSAESSPLFSMSGDGTDDINIPTVFLYSQDASKLLLTLSKNPFIEVTISEWKSDTEEWPPSEEDSVFQKLKLSVQEFLNKHTGIAFTQTIIVGSFKADVGIDKIRIVYQKVENEDIPTEDITNHQWSQIRKGLLNSLLNSDSGELFVPINILRIYYQTLSGASNEDLKERNILQQTEWLLKELSIEYHRKDDNLIKQNSDLIDFVSGSETNEAISEDLETNKKKFERLNTIFQAISQIERNVIDELKKRSSDELIITDHTEEKLDKIIISQDWLDGAQMKSDGDSQQKQEMDVKND